MDEGFWELLNAVGLFFSDIRQFHRVESMRL